jgi:D-alanine--poly(phosphoribitol) ligase subunit 1
MQILFSDISSAFSQKFRFHAEKVALYFSFDKKITYQELDKLSNQFANFFIEQRLQKSDRIALCLEKTLCSYAILLAAIKVGIPYFFLDPRSPSVRLDKIFNQCSPTILFHHSSYRGPCILNSIICPENSCDLPIFITRYAVELQETTCIAVGSDPAYIMFTSGSTGFPKGAVISRDNLCNFIQWIDANFAFTSNDVHTHLNPLYFDNSVFDIFSTFYSGGMLVPFDNNIIQSPRNLVARLNEAGCTVWFSVPSLLIYLQTLKLLTRENFKHLKFVIFGGEGYPKKHLHDLFVQIDECAEIINVYGPTECTCICSSYRITRNDLNDQSGFASIGYLNNNFTHLLLNENKVALQGEVGELCLGGVCVGLGYFNQPELTKKSFIQNPLVTSHRDILYRTGDLFRIDVDDNKLYFMGRIDSQIKHMGYRIELEEIQNVLYTFDGVNEVIAMQGISFGLSEIIVVIATQELIKRSDLNNFMVNNLPEYMVPSKIYFVANMPKNANGKTDRNALVNKFIK